MARFGSALVGKGKANEHMHRSNREMVAARVTAMGAGPLKLPRRISSTLSVAFVLLACLLPSMQATAGDWYVSSTGKADGRGTADSPWDVDFAFGGAKKAIKPGDTICMAEGTYKLDRSRDEANVYVRLAGQEGQPITIRPLAGAHVIIDGGIRIGEPSAFVIIRDLEILVSEPRPKEPLDRDPTYANIKKFRPWGGLEISEGRNCKYINLVVHDCLQGIGFWENAIDSEIYGCIIYDNGWAAKDRGHGHAVYTQNRQGAKAISNCIFTGGYGWTMHAYGSPNAFIDNYRISDNITYASHNDFLVGGEKASKGIHLSDNFFHSAGVRVGYTAKGNEDVEFIRNVLCLGHLSFNNYRKVDFAENTLLATSLDKSAVEEFTARDNEIVPQADLAEAKPVIFLRPNKYDPKRAHLAIYDPAAKDAASVTQLAIDTGGLLKDGQKFRLMDPRDLWGKTIFSGIAKGKTIEVTVKGDLAVYVLLTE